MQYKTIILRLLRDQRPEIHYQLKQNRMLLPTLERLGPELKTCHEAWKESLSRSSLVQDEFQIASEALELALEDLDGCLQTLLPQDYETPEEGELLSLNEAVTFLRRHLPPA